MATIMRTQMAPVVRQSPDRILNDSQRDTNVVRQAVNKVPDVNGMKTDPLTFAGGDTQTINHGLKRIPTEFRAVWVTGGASSFYVVSADDKTIVIYSVGACDATFRVS